MKREEILAVYEAGPEAVIKLVNTIFAIIFEQLRADYCTPRAGMRL